MDGTAIAMVNVPVSPSLVIGKLVGLLTFLADQLQLCLFVGGAERDHKSESKMGAHVSLSHVHCVLTWQV